jgi:hypothetical protein
MNLTLMVRSKQTMDTILSKLRKIQNLAEAADLFHVD